MLPFSCGKCNSQEGVSKPALSPEILQTFVEHWLHAGHMRRQQDPNKSANKKQLEDSSCPERMYGLLGEYENMSKYNVM